MLGLAHPAIGLAKLSNGNKKAFQDRPNFQKLFHRRRHFLPGDEHLVMLQQAMALARPDKNNIGFLVWHRERNTRGPETKQRNRR
jgi:hypothetical protein